MAVLRFTQMRAFGCLRLSLLATLSLASPAAAVEHMAGKLTVTFDKSFDGELFDPSDIDVWQVDQKKDKWLRLVSDCMVIRLRLSCLILPIA